MSVIEALTGYWMLATEVFVSSRSLASRAAQGAKTKLLRERLELPVVPVPDEPGEIVFKPLVVPSGPDISGYQCALIRTVEVEDRQGSLLARLTIWAFAAQPNEQHGQVRRRVAFVDPQLLSACAERGLDSQRLNIGPLTWPRHIDINAVIAQSVRDVESVCRDLYKPRTVDPSVIDMAAEPPRSQPARTSALASQGADKAVGSARSKTPARQGGSKQEWRGVLAAYGMMPRVSGGRSFQQFGVLLDTPDGQVPVYGTDLGRALDEAKAQIGQKIVVKWVSSEPPPADMPDRAPKKIYKISSG